MGLFKKIGRIGTNIGKAVKKAGKDTFNEVKRHPVMYGVGAGLLTAGMVNPGLFGALGSAAKAGAVGAGKLAGAGAGKVLGAGKAIGSGALKAGKAVFSNGKGGFDRGKLGKVATVGAGMVGQHQDQKRAERYLNQEQTRRDQFTDMAKQQYASGQGFRDLALQKLSGLGNSPTRKYLNG
jgi:hypothetical protein